MKIWVYLNGIQQGPYTLDEVAAMNLLPSTPVWYEGITQWLPASEAPVTAVLFSGENASASEAEPDGTADIVTTEATYTHVAASQSSNRQDIPPCPKTYMAWSIFATICCCTPGGILAIIFTSMVTGNYNRGDYERAAKMAEYAEWTIIISIVLGIIAMPIMLAMF